ncbi:hypothetical protein EJ110_NYTH11303 [Nymphaea thermarum]|nr:hypothetical protein EJ110_NYTH11303 [Nymphaea thermarum]
MEADSRYCQEKRNAEVQLYESEVEAHGRSVVAEMRNRQQEADAEIIIKRVVTVPRSDFRNNGPDAEAQFYERELEAHRRSAVAEMRNRQHEVDAEL